MLSLYIIREHCVTVYSSLKAMLWNPIEFGQFFFCFHILPEHAFSLLGHVKQRSRALRKGAFRANSNNYDQDPAMKPNSMIGYYSYVGIVYTYNSKSEYWRLSPDYANVQADLGIGYSCMHRKHALLWLASVIFFPFSPFCWVFMPR